jgi:hypothetical protein
MTLRRLTSVLYILVMFCAISVGTANADSVVVNGNDANQTTFDGWGYISAGGELRLLMDYPPQQRSDILDLLFCSPNPANAPASGYCASGIWGAAIQILKVEVGGDTSSSVGAESSFLHTRAEFDTLNNAFAAHDLASERAGCNLNRGYEWWIMREARKRNPNIKLAALAWGAPGWVSNDPTTLLTTDMQQYYSDFAKCASINNDASISGTTLDYIGVWNERSYTASWINGYKSLLDSDLTGFGIPVPKIICCDGGDVSGDSDWSTFANSVDVLGQHYLRWPYTWADPLGKSLWSSEDWWGNGDPLDPSWPPGVWPNAGRFGEMFSSQHDGSGVTGTLIVPAVDAYYSDLPSSDWGPILAYRPWSGNYTVEPMLWVTAQYTQFTEPGWKFLEGASCFMGTDGSHPCRTDRGLGSYVTLRDPSSGNWSTIVETMNATSSQPFRLCPMNLGTPPPVSPRRDVQRFNLASTTTRR